YRSFLRGAKPARVSADVWIGRAIRLPLLAVRAVTIAVRGTALRIGRYRRGSAEPIAPAHSAVSGESGGEPSFYEIYGLVIASEIDLPALRSRDLASTATPDVKIMFGRISPALITAAGDRFLHAENDEILLTVPHVARYCLARGNEVLVDSEAGVDPSL